ncbi:hypothetical protein [Vulcanisaeta souniana]|uniref:hypothetical protein n=1 Tax=Vulcanisaeta souniana TaxID=164452 RepID=UPI000A9D9387|nr:hypothetical protein [Vulcanisaeta souniana]
MLADAEVLAVGVESLRAIDIGDFRIRINDRRVIDQLLSKIGVTNEVKPAS